MQIVPAKRMEGFEEGIFQVLNEKKQEVEAQGGKVYNFSVGTPDFQPARHIMDAVCAAAAKPENYKYALKDLPELTESVIKRYKTRYGVDLVSSEIMSVYGSQEGIAHIGLSLINEGDIVLVPDPGYPIFAIGPALAGARLETYSLSLANDWLPDLEELAAKYGKGADEGRRAKMMIVSYPLNPICKAAPDSFYERLIPWARENEILILHDNAYSDIIYDGRVGRSILSFEGAKEVAVEFYSLSKSFNYTGARMGFLAGNEKVVQNFKKLRSQIDYGTFLPVQYGAIAALTGPDDKVRAQCAEYERRRNVLCDGFTELGWPFERSQGTMFAWSRIPERFGDDDVHFVMELLEKSGVLCTPGSSFGEQGKGHVRFALVLPAETIREALKQVADSGVLG
ncbi:MAG: aminotransferase class I/II-fold pyridoxal phosphate-dependent enzyme [Clostridium sp.]|nr:aminotransferase class I/II-fold pyridoxal phosphate-dependent enzyme [Acetatifactor muris]MCM1526480.1 aminotransferase class I/II-fold pyridoxal phosphate-dependent enzyme [Bacteroides sp.]MCM1562394.1 aminotransferase class I/II-fold pyridoxal phosphate-dependent enzyme [Clostridium sp.]